MFRRLKFAAIKLIRTVFRIKMASSSTLNFDILPPATEPIGTYWQRLLLLAQAQGVSKLKEWRVVQARAFKTRPFHNTNTSPPLCAARMDRSITSQSREGGVI